MSRKEIKSIRNRLWDMERQIQTICPHKKVIQINFGNNLYKCNVCKKSMHKDQIPKESTICEYSCKVSK